MNILGKKSVLLAKILAVLGFWRPEISIAKTFNYLEGPIKGEVKLKLSSKPSPIKYQIIGNLRPFNLYINGNKLATTENRSSLKKGLYVNDKFISSLKGNSFYSVYTQNKEDKKLEIKIADGKVLRKVVLKRDYCFIEYPLNIHAYRKKQKDYEFKLEGICPNSNLDLVASENVTILKRFTPGENILSLSQMDKIITVSFNLKERVFDKDKIQLNIVKEKYSTKNPFLTGVVYPKNSSLMINGKRVKVHDRGDFKVYIPFKYRYKKLFYNIQSDKDFVSGKVELDINEKSPWYLAKEKNFKYFWDINFVETYSTYYKNPRFQEAQDKFKLDFQISKMFDFYSYGLNLIKREPTSIGDYYTSYQFYQDISLGFNLSFYTKFSSFYGVNLNYRNMKIDISKESCQRCETLEYDGLDLTFGLGHKYNTGDNWDLFSEIQVGVPVTNMPYDHILRLKFINFRLYF